MDEEQDPKTEDEEAVARLLERAGPRPPIPQEDLDALTAVARSAWRMEVDRRSRAAARRPVRVLVGSLAAMLALAVGLSLWWTLRPSPVPPTAAWVEEVKGPVQLEGPAPRRIAEGDPIPLAAVVFSDGEGRASLRLPDGATVRLDAGTRLRLVSATILELERGGIYVDTGGGPEWPRAGRAIEVRTPLGTARDIGTQFAVRLDPQSSSLLVRVRDGAVAVEQNGRTYRTPAGRELVLHRDGTAETSAAAGHGPGWDWILGVSPGFDIEGQSLEDFLAWVSRETGWRIVLESGLEGSSPKIVLHGTLGELRADEAPFAVLPGAGLEGELQGGTLIVRRPVKAPG